MLLEEVSKTGFLLERAVPLDQRASILQFLDRRGNTREVLYQLSIQVQLTV